MKLEKKKMPKIDEKNTNRRSSQINGNNQVSSFVSVVITTPKHTHNR